MQAVTGKLYYPNPNVGNHGGRTAFIYWVEHDAKLWLDGAIYDIPPYTGLNWAESNKVVYDGQNIWVFYKGYTNELYLHRYQIEGWAVVLKDVTNWGDSRSNPIDGIVLSNGKVVFCWCQVPEDDSPWDMPVHFIYGDEGGWSQTVQIMIGAIHGARGVLAQHPSDDAIWYFHMGDSLHQLQALRLVVSGSDLVITDNFPEYITEIMDGNAMCPNGECSPMPAVQDTANGKILLAYGNKHFEFFCYSPYHCKREYVSVLEIAADGSRRLRAEIQRDVDAYQNFVLGVKDGKFWIAYAKVNPQAKVNPEECAWKELWFYSEDGAEEYLGQLRDADPFLVPTVHLTGSSNYIIAEMEDDKIHVFALDGEPGPPVPPGPTNKAALVTGIAIGGFALLVLLSRR